MEGSLTDDSSSPLLSQGMFERVAMASFRWYPDSKGRNVVQPRSGEQEGESSILSQLVGSTSDKHAQGLYRQGL